MRTVCGVLTLAGVLAAAPAFAITAFIVDARTRAPIANAEVTVVGERGSVRTGSDGGFEWALPEMLHVVFVIILPDGRVARPIHITAPDAADSLTLLVEPAVAQTVDVSGTAPGIDFSAGASSSLVTAADINLRHPATLSQIIEIIPGVGLISEGQSATPALRGLARGRTTILVDGSRASSERRSGPNASFIDPSIVDRIEVARGPASVAYGSDAMGASSPCGHDVPTTAAASAPDWAARSAAVSRKHGGIWKSRPATAPVESYLVSARGSSTATSPRAGQCRTRAGATTVCGCGGSTGRDPRSGRSAGSATGPVTSAARAATPMSCGSSRPWKRRIASRSRTNASRSVGSVGSRRRSCRLAPPPDGSGSSRHLDPGANARAGGRQLARGSSAGNGRPDPRKRTNTVGRRCRRAPRTGSVDTVRSYNLAGGLVSSQATPSIERAHRTNAGAFAQAQVQPARRIRLSGGVRADIVRSVNRGGYFGDRSRNALGGGGLRSSS